MNPTFKHKDYDHLEPRNEGIRKAGLWSRSFRTSGVVEES